MKTNFDVVVIGAGPAGTTAACKLMQEGFTVKILEKMEFPRFVIGESLLPHCMDYLDELGLLKCVEDLNFQVKSGACFYQNDKICDFRFDKQFTEPSWKYTYQVKRADFDHALALETQKKGADLEFKAEVLDVQTSATQQTVKYKDAENVEHTLTCKFVMDASGYGRVLPRMFDLEVPVPSPPRSAIFSHLADENRTEIAGNNIFVHSFNNNTSWIWCIPFSDRTCSVGIVGDTAFVHECAEESGAKYKELVRTFPGLHDRFADADYKFEPRVVENYSVSVKQLYGVGYILCGNSTEFLDPIFSSGVTLAVSSGYKAADLVARHLKGESVNFNDYSVELQKGIEVFRSYVNGWYDGSLQNIFFSNRTNDDFKQQICSVLAGYIWDEKNPFVRKHQTILKTLNHVVNM